MGLKELPINHQPLQGALEMPGDKSISHRAVILGAMANGVTTVENFLHGEDCLRTVAIFEAMGVTIENQTNTLIIHGNGTHALEEPDVPLYFGNSGTTARLMIGVLAGLSFFSTVYGDPYLTERPMERVLTPASKMGVAFDGRKDGSFLPLAIRGGGLEGIHYTLPVKSAQVKSAVLLAGLSAKGVTTILEETPTRNHTENMLEAFGAEVNRNEKQISINGLQQLHATNVYVPGDISSASFFLTAAAIVPNSTLTLRNIGLNPTRAGMMSVLKKMGARMTVDHERTISGERLGDVTISYSELIGTTIEGDIIPCLIDEIPVIALLATQAQGTTIIRDAAELRMKETDRIAAVVEVLSTLGADITSTEDGMIIHGKTTLHGGYVRVFHDHRIAMMASISSLITTGQVILDDDDSIAISYPDFFADLKQVLT